MGRKEGDVQPESGKGGIPTPRCNLLMFARQQSPLLRHMSSGAQQLLSLAEGLHGLSAGWGTR